MYDYFKHQLRSEDMRAKPGIAQGMLLNYCCSRYQFMASWMLTDTVINNYAEDENNTCWKYDNLSETISTGICFSVS